MSIKIQGIYRIRNLVNDKVYIGNSNNIKRRWRHHLHKLRWDNHQNPHLQNAWNKYGEDNFVFEIVENVNRSQDLKRREQWFLDNVVNWGIDYNIARDATNPGLGRIGKNNPLFGKTFTDDHKQKLSKAKKGAASQGINNNSSKLTEDDVIKIRSIHGKYSCRKLGEMFGVTGATINYVINKKTWKHI